MASKKRKHQRANPVPKTGVCALLGVEGKFAKSHLIPLALTSPDKKGDRFIEAGRGQRPIRRFTSWFDHQMVIDDGESILSRIDTRGIDELRKHKLVWSGWNGLPSLEASDYDIPPLSGSGFGFRGLEGVDSKALRLFFLSILWRCLKSKIKEFAFLPREGVDLDRIGQMILNGDSGSFDYHPMILDQMSDSGVTHNYSPTYDEDEVPLAGGRIKIAYYRLYMQGLVVKIYPESCPEFVAQTGPLILGAKDKLVLFARAFEESKQFSKARDEILTISKAWPGAIV
nr:hypothetical protein FFPRI1PSEUD_44340 [Pseudomonas sp. FFPRI_1]